MHSENNSYRQIFKALSIFGGVQMVTTLILLIKSKFIALYLGPGGFGISSLYNSTLAFVVAISSLGISYSAVRDIASANSTGDSYLRSKAITIFNRWIIFTGIAGSLVVILLSKQISIWTFGNSTSKWSFILLSITIFLTTYSNGRKTILQGLGKLKNMANLSIWGTAIGLFTIPLYYYYGQKGIVPALVISAIVLGLLSWYFSKNIKIEPIKISHRQAFNNGLDMVKFGTLLTISGFYYILGIYILNIFINKINGPRDVGLYQAGWLIINQIVSLVFAAMSIDYYPRLAAVHSDNNKIKVLVNQQTEITLLIIGPLLVLLIIFVPFIIKIFLTNSFISISNFIRLTAIGTIFKAVQSCLGYILLVKGDVKKYMILELTGFTLIFVSYMLGYYLNGIDGMGLAFIFSYFCFVLCYYLVIRKAFNFGFNYALIKILIVITLFCLAVYILSLLSNALIYYVTGSILATIICNYSFMELDKRMSIKNIVNQIFQRKQSIK